MHFLNLDISRTQAFGGSLGFSHFSDERCDGRFGEHLCSCGTAVGYGSGPSKGHLLLSGPMDRRWLFVMRLGAHKRSGRPHSFMMRAVTAPPERTSLSIRASERSRAKNYVVGIPRLGPDGATASPSKLFFTARARRAWIAFSLECWARRDWSFCAFEAHLDARS